MTSLTSTDAALRARCFLSLYWFDSGCCGGGTDEAVDATGGGADGNGGDKILGT